MARFLYVEDNDDLRNANMKLLPKVLPKDEFVAVTTYDEALTALRERGPFDGVVSDYNYSGVLDNGRVNEKGFGGLDLLRYIQKNEIKAPFAFFSGRAPRYIEGELAEAKLELPADHIFAKPQKRLPDIIKFLKERYCREARPDAPDPTLPPSLNS